MLDPGGLVAQKIRDRRQALGLSLRALGRRVGTSHAYLYQVEAGLRPLAPARAPHLEAALGLGDLRLAVRRGRPPLSPEGRQIVGALRKSDGLPEIGWLRPGRVPAYPRPDRVPPRQDRFKPTSQKQRLERIRAKEPRFWHLLNSLRFDSGSERELALEVGLGCQELTRVSPAQVGCRLLTVSGRSGKDRQKQAAPAFLLQRAELKVAWFVQPCVATGCGFRWPDNLLVACHKGVRQTVVVEVDGPAYHSCSLSEQGRDSELGVPVLHLHPARMSLRAILDWVTKELDRLVRPPP